MKKYKKEIDGKVSIKTLNEIVLNKDDSMIFNPTEEMILADGWVEYLFQRIELPMEMQLKRVKERKLRELERYDASENVNDCIIFYNGQEIHYWAKVEQRTELEKAVRDCVTMGRETYRLDLRDKEISMIIPCDKLLQMIAMLEVYAVDCYNKTTDHRFAISSLTTLKDVEEYDFKVGYPEKLRFEV